MRNKIQIIVLLISIFGALGLHAEDFNFQVKNYKDATEQITFLKFEMESTKLGLVTTGFSGFVKEFLVSANTTDGKFTDAKITFPIKSMDTDIDGRNVKMWESCFNYEKYPDIVVNVVGDIAVTEDWKEYPATIDVRGKKQNIKVKLKSLKSGELYKIDLESNLSIKDLEIPDPSIFIATVRDRVDLKGHFEIPSKEK